MLLVHHDPEDDLIRSSRGGHERVPLIRAGEQPWRSSAPFRVFGNVLLAAFHAGVSLLILIRFSASSEQSEFPTLVWFCLALASFVLNTCCQIAMNIITSWPSIELMFSGVVLSFIQAGPALHAFSALGLTIETDEEASKLKYSWQLIVKLMLFTAPQVMIHLHAFIFVNYHQYQVPFAFSEGLLFFGCCLGILSLVFGYATCMENAGFDVLPLVAMPMFLRVFGEVVLRTLLFTLILLKFQIYTVVFVAFSALIYVLAVLWKEKRRFKERIRDILISIIPAFFVSRVYVICKEYDLQISKFPIFDKRLTWLRILENLSLFAVVGLSPAVPGAIEVSSTTSHIALGVSFGLWILGIAAFEKIVH